MQQVDVQAVGLVGEVGGDQDRKPFRMRRPRGAVGLQPGQLALALHQLGVGVQDLGGLAVQADADVVGELRVTGPSTDRAARMTNSKWAMS